MPKQPPKKVVLNDASVAAIKPPESGRLMVHDKHTRGFVVRVTPTGAKTLALYRRIKGRPKIERIGKWPDMSVAEARGKIKEGLSPKAARGEMTFGALFAEYMQRHSIPNKRTSGEDQSLYDRRLKHWADRKASDISRGDVQALRDRIARSANRFDMPGERRGNVHQANRALALLSHVFNWAAKSSKLTATGKDTGEPLFSGENPAKGVDKFPVEPRERWLRSDEAPAFFEALEAEPNETLRDFVWLDLYTGARRGNVLAMRWDELDLERGVWTIPGDKSKNGKPITVYLVPQALEVLRARHTAATPEGAEAPETPWVFPADSKTGHFQEPRKGVLKILERAGIKDLRIHDLRHTMGAALGNAGASQAQIAKALGHRNIQTSARYTHIDEGPQRAITEKAIGALLQSGNAAPAEKLAETLSDVPAETLASTLAEVVRLLNEHKSATRGA